MIGINHVMDNMTLEEKAKMCAGANFWFLQGVKRLGVPSIMAADGPHGLRKQMGASDHLGINESIKAVCFPTAAGLACSFDRKLLRQVGVTLGNECQSEGVGILLGPGVNIKRSPLCGRNFEYFSEDPYLSSELASAQIEGLQSKGIACSVKHYLANNQESERMSSNSVVDERALNEIYLASFEGPVVKAKAQTVMCSYNKINGTYAAENYEMLTGVLRKKWGFEGLVVTDWGAVKDRIKGLKAGLDLKMPGGNPDVDAAEILQAIENNELDEDTLDAAVKNILSVIAFVTNNKEQNTRYSRDEDHLAAMDAAVQSAVLLKNEDTLLPLEKSAKISLIGEFARFPRCQGSGSSHINTYKLDNAVDYVAGCDNISYTQGYVSAGDKEDVQLLSAAVEEASSADVAVIFAGLPDTYESEGFDRKNLNLPPNQNALIEAVCAVQPNTVVVLHMGACVLMPWREKVKSILSMNLGGEAVGSATVKLLFGDAVPSGKLAESYPVQLSDTPSFLNFPSFEGRTVYHESIFVGYRYYDKKNMEVQYPFGHGLSYTTFSYSNLCTSSSAFSDTDMIDISVDITNTGIRAGKEVVQLYVCPLEGTVPRPVRELKNFDKVELQPGETKTVTFKLSKRAFAYYSTQMHDWHVESGKYQIEAAASSRDIRQSVVVTVTSTVEISLDVTFETTIGQILATQKGRTVMAPIMQAIQKREGEAKDATDSAMGESAQAMKQAMIMEMPLQSLATFGIVTLKQLQGIVNAINR
nr:glycoside hydrolase family 3 C-terminal domain-containing protein [uncultured Clostridium sp.]